MNAQAFPRTMQRGRFRGQRFETGAEYQQALHGSNGKAKAVDAYVFHLRLTSGSLSVEVTGDPRKPEDVDRLLSLLGEYGAK